MQLFGNKCKTQTHTHTLTWKQFNYMHDAMFVYVLCVHMHSWSIKVYTQNYWSNTFTLRVVRYVYLCALFPFCLHSLLFCCHIFRYLIIHIIPIYSDNNIYDIESVVVRTESIHYFSESFFVVFHSKLRSTVNFCGRKLNSLLFFKPFLLLLKIFSQEWMPIFSWKHNRKGRGRIKWTQEWKPPGVVQYLFDQEAKLIAIYDWLGSLFTQWNCFF